MLRCFFGEWRMKCCFPFCVLISCCDYRVFCDLLNFLMSLKLCLLAFVESIMSVVCTGDEVHMNGNEFGVWPQLNLFPVDIWLFTAKGDEVVAVELCMRCCLWIMNKLVFFSLIELGIIYGHLVVITLFCFIRLLKMWWIRNYVYWCFLNSLYLSCIVYTDGVLC